MENLLLITLSVLNILWIITYKKQRRLNRLLLHLFHDYPNKKYILDHIYVKDVLNIKKDMNNMINADIDISELEKALKKDD